MGVLYRYIIVVLTAAHDECESLIPSLPSPSFAAACSALRALASPTAPSCHIGTNDKSGAWRAMWPGRAGVLEAPSQGAATRHPAAPRTRPGWRAGAFSAVTPPPPRLGASGSPHPLSPSILAIHSRLARRALRDACARRLGVFDRQPDGHRHLQHHHKHSHRKHRRRTLVQRGAIYCDSRWPWSRTVARRQRSYAGSLLPP